MMKIRDILFPSKCICCGELLDYNVGSSPMCKICASKWEAAKQTCRVESYGQPVRAYNFGNSIESEYVLYLVNYIPTERDSVQNRLILNLKDRGTCRIVEFIASELAAVIKEHMPDNFSFGDMVITWIPRRRSAVLKCGFDHMERVARVLSRMLGIPCSAVLKRRLLSAEQKTLTHSDRRKNASRSMYISKREELAGKTVVLIDDIITSGASLDAATEMLMDAGARLVMAATVSATERPKEKPRNVESVFNIIKK